MASPAEAPNFPLRYSDAVPSGGAAAAVATAPVKEAVSKPVTRTTYVPPPPAKSKVWWWAVAAVVVVGGALGTALYLQKKPLQLPTVVPMATSPRSAQDNRIKTSVSGALASHDYNKLTVAVDQGVVTLGGNVSTAAQADDAVRLATVQDGVKQVRNEISFPAIAPAGAPGPTPEAARREKPAERPAARPVVAKTERVTTQQRRRVQALLAQGDRLTLAGEYAAAIEAYNSVLAIDRTDPAARAGLARAEQAKAAEENILRRRR